MAGRAVHEIQSEVVRLATVNVTGAADACDWVALHRLAERLAELAERGLYHASQEKARGMASFAMNCHAESEPR
jgi:hypothetical protein